VSASPRQSEKKSDNGCYRIFRGIFNGITRYIHSHFLDLKPDPEEIKFMAADGQSERIFCRFAINIFKTFYSHLRNRSE